MSYRPIGVTLWLAACLVLGGAGLTAFAKAPASLAEAQNAASEGLRYVGAAAPAALTFNGAEYFHRWSQKGQHEFTRQGDEDLSKWTEMVTINVHDRVRTGEDLAELANGVLGNYEANGHIMRTISKPRTEKTEAEHFVAAVLQAPNVFEVAFARFLLHEKRGVVAVYSKRFYGADAQAEMTAWFKANAVPIERVLVGWTGIPSLAVLNKLPSSPR